MRAMRILGMPAEVSSARVIVKGCGRVVEGGTLLEETFQSVPVTAKVPLTTVVEVAAMWSLEALESLLARAEVPGKEMGRWRGMWSRTVKVEEMSEVEGRDEAWLW